MTILRLSPPAFALLLCLALAGAGGAGEQGPSTLTKEAIPTPIADAAIGDWAYYQLDSGKRSKLKVVERAEAMDGDFLLVIENRVSDRKKRKKDRDVVTTDMISVAEQIKNQRELGREDFVTSAEMLVGGRRLDAIVVNYVEDGKVVRQSYYSDQVPVYGLIRGIVYKGTTKRIVIDLRDFGHYGDDEE